MIILFGLAGSGKGTQGQALAQLFGWQWLSNGEVIRRSHEYDYIINQGKLIPDQDVIDMMNAEIHRLQAQGFDLILDGYPRDKTQAEYLLQHFADQIQGAIVLDVPKEELYQRLALRGRDDDHSRASIDQRFAVFEQNICSILHLFDAYHIPYAHVDGTGPIETVTTRLIETIQSFDPSIRPKTDPNPQQTDPNPQQTDLNPPQTDPNQPKTNPNPPETDPTPPNNNFNHPTKEQTHD